MDKINQNDHVFNVDEWDQVITGQDPEFKDMWDMDDLRQLTKSLFSKKTRNRGEMLSNMVFYFEGTRATTHDPYRNKKPPSEYVEFVFINQVDYTGDYIAKKYLPLTNYDIALINYNYLNDDMNGDRECAEIIITFTDKHHTDMEI